MKNTDLDKYIALYETFGIELECERLETEGVVTYRVSFDADDSDKIEGIGYIDANFDRDGNFIGHYIDTDIEGSSLEQYYFEKFRAEE
jgi:hypothetical protein